MTASTEENNPILGQLLKRLNDQDQRLTALEHDIKGNGSQGLKARMIEVERNLFYDPRTGDKGMIQKVNNLDSLIISTRAQLRLLNWMIGFFGTAGIAGGVVWFVRIVFGPTG